MPPRSNIDNSIGRQAAAVSSNRRFHCSSCGRNEILVVGGSFYLILLRISFSLGSILSSSNSFFDKFKEFSKAKTMFLGFKSDVTFLYAEYQITSMSFSRFLVGLSQCCVLVVLTLISQSKYF